MRTPHNLRVVHKERNLSNREFRDVWPSWWPGEVPPSLKPDLIVTFENPSTQDAFLVALEVEYFRNERKSFSDGIQQVMAFAIFGFDGLSLWHFFDGELDMNAVDGYRRATDEVIRGFNLPIFYLPVRILDSQRFELEFIQPYAPFPGKLDYFADLMYQSCSKKPNPLLATKEVAQRKQAMKSTLRIPK